MRPERAENERLALRDQQKFHRYVIGGLLATNLLAGAGWFWTVLNQMTVFVPPDSTRQYAVGNNFANRDYLVDSTHYVLDLINSVTPETIDRNNRVILKMTHPDGFGALKVALDAAASEIKRSKLSTVWIPRTEQANERARTVRVKGIKKTFIADVLTSSVDREYQVTFDINSAGQIYVVKVDEIVPDNAKPSAAGGAGR